MRGRGRARFHLSDGMVLIAGLALGLTAARAYLGITKGIPYGGSLGLWINAINNGGVPFALVWSVILVLIRGRAARHERRRLCCQPGFSAALAVVACAAVVLLDHIAKMLFLRAKSGAWQPFDAARTVQSIVNILMLAAPSAVAATWVILAVSGRWRPESSWVDRTGLLLGIYWVLWPEIAWVVALGVA